MTKRRWVGMLSALAAAGAAVAQTPVPAESGGTFSIAVPGPAGAPDVMMYRANHVAGTPGDNVTFIASEFSFEGGVVKNAPYSAQAVTETTQRLADGNRISHKTTATLYRDKDGRTRREETIGAIGPWSSNAEPFQTIFINDPVSKTNMILDSRNKTVEKMTSPEVRTFKGQAGATGAVGMVGFAPANRVATLTPGPGQPAMVGVAGSLSARTMMMAPDQNGKTEPLPAQTIEGVRAEGSRSTVTIPAGSIGNDLAIEIVSERWYSPELQTVVMTKRNDPRMGETVYRLTNINRNEPARSLFEAPADYTVVDQQQLKRNAEEQFRRAMEEKSLREKAKE